MAGGFNNYGKDSLDITELASLNDDISDDLIDQLEHELSEKIGVGNKNSVPVNENDDSTLFEETQEDTTSKSAEKSNAGTPLTENSASSETASAPQNNSDAQIAEKDKTDGNTVADNKSKQTDTKTEEQKDTKKGENKDTSEPKSERKEIANAFDDNFIKKYKAKLKNRAQSGDKNQPPPSYGVAPGDDEQFDNSMKERSKRSGAGSDAEGDIAALSQGNITEKALNGEYQSYNDSLDFLDRNIKYSKYVIYIDPQNVNFIESLTVKERKNLINGILRQQEDISLTKLRFKVIQTVIRHVIITVLTVAISIPAVYYVINASLEATINNHRSAQTNWQTLYKEHGKITHN